jgi:predicted nucleic acid-binding protein
VKGIADTGFLVAFVRQSDRHHEWAVSVASRVTEPLLTCDAVLAETAFHLESVALPLTLVDEGLVALAFSCHDHLPRIAALAKTYADRKPDLANLCLICLSELHPRHSVVTVDRSDFRMYRRNKREMISWCARLPADVTRAPSHRGPANSQRSAYGHHCGSAPSPCKGDCPPWQFLTTTHKFCPLGEWNARKHLE